MRIMGIDPGKTGAATIISVFAPTKIKIFPFTSKNDNINLQQLKLELPNIGMIMIEDVHAMPHDAKQAIFTFGRMLGQIEGAIVMAGYREWFTVRPQKWQKVLKLVGPYEDGKRKKAHLARAEELFGPQKGLNQQTADSALIAYYTYLEWRNNDEL